MTPVLFLSNGFGEDAIAGGIVEALQRRGVPVLALPLVGEGRAYANLGVEVVGPQRMMPSGGLIMGAWLQLFGDVRAGLWKMTTDQIATLRRLGPQVGAVVAVGDTYPVVLAGLFSRHRVIMVGTARSNYFVPYSGVERAVFRRHCEVVFARDEDTAATLRGYGVNARWVGNCMMDLLATSGEPLPLAGEGDVIAVLPGSRNTAYRDLPVLLSAVVLMSARRNLAPPVRTDRAEPAEPDRKGGPLRFCAALADSLDLAGIANCLDGGWALERCEGGRGIEGRLRRHDVEVLLVRGRFGDVLEASRLVIGQAGTGNEQAAGLGRPVVSFDSDGRARPGWYRARQMGLLGDALAVVPRSAEAVAAEALRILDQPSRYRHMQKVGFERMGPPGACEEIAAYIVGALDVSPAPGSPGSPVPRPC